MMNETLAPFIDKFVVVYLNDILISSRSEEEHKQHLHEVLQTLREAKLTCKRSKYEFGMTEVEYLGHFVGADGTRMDDHKVEVVTKWPAPKGIKELRSFLGLAGIAGYYRRFIDHYATRVKPMSELPKQDVPWNWGKEQQESFKDLKTTMTSASLEMSLSRPDGSQASICSPSVTLHTLSASASPYSAASGQRSSDASPQSARAAQVQASSPVHPSDDSRTSALWLQRTSRKSEAQLKELHG